MSKVTAKYQVTIPVKVRKELGIAPGTKSILKKRDKNMSSLLTQKSQGKMGVEG